MTYFSHRKKEMPHAGVQEGELAIYTGTVNPRQPDRLKSGDDSRNAYVYLWRDGQPEELDAQFWRDSSGQDVLEVQAGEETYIFLRDKPSGYIRQTAGPAKPIAVANFGAIPLRVDTFLGKFTVYAGTMLRLDENAPKREKKEILLTLSSRYKRPLERAELWEEGAWRRLNIRNEPDTYNGEHGQTVLDGSAVVQYLTVSGNQGILMMDSPEPDPDYEIFVTAQYGDRVTLRFNRTDYQGGRIVERSRTISNSGGKPVAYELQKLRESPTQAEVKRCTVEVAGLPDEWKADPALVKRERPLAGDKLRAFLEDEDASVGPADETGAESGQEDCGREERSHSLAELPHGFEQGATELRDIQRVREGATPEPPEDFPA